MAGQAGSPIEALDINLLGLVLVHTDSVSRVSAQFVSRAFDRALAHNDVLLGRLTRSERAKTTECAGQRDGVIRAHQVKYIRAALADMSQSLFQWAFAQPFTRHVDVARMAVEAGRLDAVQYMYARGAFACTRILFESAAGARSLVILDWMYSVGYTYFDDPKLGFDDGLGWAPYRAVANDDLPMLRWLYEHGADLRLNLVWKALILDRVAILRWLCVHGCLLDAGMPSFVIRTSKRPVEALRALLDAGCSVDASASRTAITHGLLETLQLLHAHGKLLDLRQCKEWARMFSSHVHIIEWLDVLS